MNLTQLFLRETVAGVIKSERDGILGIDKRTQRTNSEFSAQERGELLAGIYIAKALARTLGSSEEQREFLTACGLPEATL